MTTTPAIADKQFREDLYFRLSMIEVRTPSLAERKDDLPLLTRRLPEKFSRRCHKEIRGLTQRAKITLARHAWPGNVRELENVFGHGCIMAMGGMIDVQDLPEYLRLHAHDVALPERIEASKDFTLDAHEKGRVMAALTRANGNQSEAARFLRIGRDALRYKIEKHGLDMPVSAAAASVWPGRAVRPR